MEMNLKDTKKKILIKKIHPVANNTCREERGAGIPGQGSVPLGGRPCHTGPVPWGTGTPHSCRGAGLSPAEPSPPADTATLSSKMKQLLRATRSQTPELSQTPACCPQSSRAELAPFTAHHCTLASNLSAELSKAPVWFANMGYTIWIFCCSATIDTHYPI